MNNEINTVEERSTKIAALGLQERTRKEIAGALGCTEKQARYALEKLRSRPEPEAPKPIPSPTIIDTTDTTPSTASFAPRENATDLTNFRDGWVREFAEPKLITETDAKGNIKTKKVIHDAGTMWPDGWQGPKGHDQLFVEAKPARPLKWGILVTSAQAHTPVHGPALMALSALCGYRGLSLSVIGVESKPTGAASKTDEVSEWSSAVDRYVTTERHDFGGIVIDGAYPIKPTHETPLDGVAAYCRGQSHVFGSMRQDMVTLPKFQDGLQASARATGTVTVPNYSRSKVGMVAIANHALGGVIIECDLQGRIFTRNVRCNPITGDLWDIDICVENGVVRDASTVIAERQLKRPVLAVGCVHVRWLNKLCAKAIWGLGGKPSDDISVVEAIDPSEQVIHDVFDAYSISPHTRKNPFLTIQREVDGDDDVAAELKLTADFIEAIGSERRNTWVIDSNHNRHFSRYLIETDWKRNLKNAATFLKVNLAQVEAFAAGDRDFDPLAYALRLANPAAKFISSKFSEPLRFFKAYFHCHGDRGSNGTTGSNTNFKNMGFDIAAAHNHAAESLRQLTRLGCIIDTPPHAQGPNNWGHSFGIEHPDGAMQLIPLVDGKWRA